MDATLVFRYVLIPQSQNNASVRFLVSKNIYSDTSFVFPKEHHWDFGGLLECYSTHFPGPILKKKNSSLLAISMGLGLCSLMLLDYKSYLIWWIEIHVGDTAKTFDGLIVKEQIHKICRKELCLYLMELLHKGS